MGCDIHCYIEYKNLNGGWSDFGGRINPGRNYAIFGLMAGVREMGPAVVAPRGKPYDMAYSSENDAWIYVDDTLKDSSSSYLDGEYSVSRERADSHVASGYAIYKPTSEGKVSKFISNSDWHSYSWLTTEEFERALEQYGDRGNYDQEYWAVLASMKSFEEQGRPSRLVFWFDN